VANKPRGHDDPIDSAQCVLRGVERFRERLRLLQVAVRDTRHAGTTAANRKVSGAAVQILQVATEEEDGVTSRGHVAGHGPAHPLRRP
jgi:hypothetical protein